MFMGFPRKTGTNNWSGNTWVKKLLKGPHHPTNQNFRGGLNDEVKTTLARQLGGQKGGVEPAAWHPSKDSRKRKGGALKSNKGKDHSCVLNT